MKTLLVALLMGFLIQAETSFAQNEPLKNHPSWPKDVRGGVGERMYSCDAYFTDARTRVIILQSLGSTLSSAAQSQLYAELKKDLITCGSVCSGSQFAFCDQLNTELSLKKPLQLHKNLGYAKP